ncbi:MAG TPA: DinB family protein [Gemmataceae bacterium]|nr:DinB family protein [Gemmataceae bacterium]
MNRLQFAIDQIIFARNYTLRLLEPTRIDDWFRQPPGGVSHIGWQVGHIAFAEYRLALWRIRGQRPEDAALFSPEFLKLFGANSVPQADPAVYPPVREVQAVMERIHAQAMRELPAMSDPELDEPVPHPHPYAKTKLLALLWCAHHEMVHAGQIGLLRRFLGYSPIW